MKFLYHYNIAQPINEKDCLFVVIEIPLEFKRFLLNETIEMILPIEMIEMEMKKVLELLKITSYLQFKPEYTGTEMQERVEQAVLKGEYQYLQERNTAYFDSFIPSESGKSKEFLIELKREICIRLIGVYTDTRVADYVAEYEDEYDDIYEDVEEDEMKEHYADDDVNTRIALEQWTQKYHGLGTLESGAIIYSDIDYGSETSFYSARDAVVSPYATSVDIEHHAIGDEIVNYLDSVESLSACAKKIMKENVLMDSVSLTECEDISSEEISFELLDVYAITKILLQKVCHFLVVDKRDMELIEELDVSKQTFYKMKNGKYLPKRSQVVDLIRKYVTGDTLFDEVAASNAEKMIELIDCIAENTIKKEGVLNNLKEATVKQWSQYDIIQAKNTDVTWFQQALPIENICVSPEMSPLKEKNAILSLDDKNVLAYSKEYEVIKKFVIIKLTEEKVQITYANGKVYLDVWLCEAIDFPCPMDLGLNQSNFDKIEDRLLAIKRIIARLEKMPLDSFLQECIIDAVHAAAELPWQSNFLVRDSMFDQSIEKEYERFVKLVGLMHLSGDWAYIGVISNNYGLVKKYMKKYNV